MQILPFLLPLSKFPVEINGLFIYSTSVHSLDQAGYKLGIYTLWSRQLKIRADLGWQTTAGVPEASQWGFHRLSRAPYAHRPCRDNLFHGDLPACAHSDYLGLHIYYYTVSIKK